MKSLDQRLSEVVSPFEDNERDQDYVAHEQYYAFRKDALIKAISQRRGYITFDLYFEEILDEMDSSDIELFLTDCITALTKIYTLDVLEDWINRNSLIDEARDQIIALIKYFVYNEYLNDIAFHLPEIAMEFLDSTEKITKLVKDTYSLTQDKIIMDEKIQPLIRHYFKYCPYSSGVNTLLVLIHKDLPGLISGQLVITRGEQKNDNS